uniref:Uncharacterized protein n=1 Tax=viral metagenome TaxID=1070528 RepID=A0A6C0JPI7_9ZZZZ
MDNEVFFNKRLNHISTLKMKKKKLTDQIWTEEMKLFLQFQQDKSRISLSAKDTKYLERLTIKVHKKVGPVE